MKILAVHESSRRYLGGDLDKAYLMLLKERFDDGWYEDNSQLRETVKNALEESDSKTAQVILRLRGNHLYEYVEEVELENANYLKPCKDVGKRLAELVEHCKNNQVWHQWMIIEPKPFTEQDRIEAIVEGVTLPSEQDYVLFGYEWNDWEHDDYDPTTFFQEFFGSVKVSCRPKCKEVEVYHDPS
jgi:hypothetical protein